MDRLLCLLRLSLPDPLQGDKPAKAGNIENVEGCHFKEASPLEDNRCQSSICRLKCLYQAPQDMENHVGPEVHSRRGNQSILHVALARHQTDDPIEQKHLDQQHWT